MNIDQRPLTLPVSRRQFLQITAVTGAVLLGGRLLKTARRPAAVSETRTLMGTVINVAVVTDDAAHGRETVAAVFAEMARLITVFDHRRSDSPLAVLNRDGALPAPPPELVDLLRQAQRYSAISGGAFDVSVKPLLDAYQAGAAAPQRQKHLVDYRQIQIDDAHILLAQPGMQLTLDGIAKGRVVDGATAVLTAAGFTNVLVEAGGDLVGLGRRADGQPWRVGIAHPRRDATLGALPVTQQAVASSGDYRHSFTQDLRAHHIIDPRSGVSPAELAGATVLAPAAMDADALSTALMVLGVQDGLALIARLPHVEALLITKDMKIVRSAGFPTAV